MGRRNDAAARAALVLRHKAQTAGEQLPPLTPAKILRPYALVVGGLAPLVLGFIYSKSSSTLRGPWGALAMLASIVWAVYIVFFKIKNDSKAYKSK